MSNYQYYRPVFDDLSNINQYQLLENICDEISKFLPANSQNFDLLCYGYFRAKKYIKAISWGEKALSSSDNVQQKTALRFNLSKCYQYANFPEKAVRYLQLNILENPHDLDSHIDLSVAWYSKNHKQQSEEILLNLLKQYENTDSREKKIIQFNLGAHEIRNGNFSQGMNLLSLGRELNIWGSYKNKFNIPEWRGDDISGEKLLVVGEGGIGDEIINSRFCRHLRDRNIKAHWRSSHGLSSIMGRLNFESVFDHTDKIERNFDYWTPAMNLPKTLNIDCDALWNGKYLSVDPQYRDKWDFINDTKKLKIGIRWSGNPLYEQDLHRSLPLSQLIDSIKHLDADIYSLQKDNGADEILQYPVVHDLSNRLDSFEDTLAVIDNMDLVISSCTSVAHASAALDKKTIVMLPIMCYYTWCEEKEHSSWYGKNTVLFRQQHPRDWTVPMVQLQNYINFLTT